MTRNVRDMRTCNIKQLTQAVTEATCFSWEAYGTVDPLIHQTSQLDLMGSHAPMESKQHSHTQCEGSKCMRLNEFAIEMFVHVTVVSVQANKDQQHVNRNTRIDLVYKKYISRVVIVSSKHNSGSWYVSDKKEYGYTYFITVTK